MLAGMTQHFPIATRWGGRRHSPNLPPQFQKWKPLVTAQGKFLFHGNGDFVSFATTIQCFELNDSIDQYLTLQCIFKYGKDSRNLAFKLQWGGIPLSFFSRKQEPVHVSRGGRGLRHNSRIKGSEESKRDLPPSKQHLPITCWDWIVLSTQFPAGLSTSSKSNLASLPSHIAG